MIHFDGFSLLLIVTFSWIGYVIGWRRCRAEMRSQIANNSSLISLAKEDGRNAIRRNRMKEQR